jgi:hypothetical protein
MDPVQSSNSFFSSFNFQRIVILIAIIMLIVSMVFIGHALYKQSTDVTWPPKTPKCPDYWTLNSSNKCQKPDWMTTDPLQCEYNGITIPSKQTCQNPMDPQ